VHWLSLGENCLSDAILKRHGLRSQATPFSHGRSNIEYAIQADGSDFRGLLKRRNLVRDVVDGKPVLRSLLYTASPGLFCHSSSQGFELTHHDPIWNLRHRLSYMRKIARWISLRGSPDEVVFLYHHRLGTSPSNIRLVVEKLSAFSVQYSANRSRKCFILCLVQNIVPPGASRTFAIEEMTDRIWIIRIDSYSTWTGNGRQFWALDDDDMIALALDAARSKFAFQSLPAS
jgi:Putative papain-like cysteine peptidase (DUF1796)